MPAAVKQYEEIVLRIERTGEDGYVVRATSPEGEAHAPFALPLTKDRIDFLVLKAAFPRRGRRRIESSALREVTELGDSLFKALFRDSVRDLYRTARASADARDHGLRVKLALTDTPELMTLPWEFLYDDPSFLSISQLTPIVRYLDLPRTRPVREVEPPLRILALVSSPVDAAELDVERERANLEEALAELSAQGAVELVWLERATLSALLEELRNGEFHIFHYIGHGAFQADAQDGVLLLENEDERAHAVSSRRLGAILQDHRTLRLAVLNACEGARTSEDDPFAGVAATLIQQGIPAVIAMQFEITDRAAVVFAQHLYDSLAGGLPVDAALAEARKAIWADDNDVEWATPVLFMRVADGRLFDVVRAGPRRESRLAVTLEALPPEVTRGAPVTWRACVENHGDAPATGLMMRDGQGHPLAPPFDLAGSETRLVTWTTQPATDETQVVTVGKPGGSGKATQASALVRVVAQGVVDQAVGDQAVGDQAVVDQPVGDRDVVDQEVVDQGVGDQGVGDQEVVTERVGAREADRRAPPPHGRRTWAVAGAALIAAVVVGVVVALLVGSSSSLQVSGTGISEGRAISLGGRPGGVTADPNGGAWVSLPDRGEVIRVDDATGQKQTFRVNGTPTAIAAGTDSIWVAGAGAGTLSRLNVVTGTPQQTHQLQSVPAAIAGNPSDGSACTAESSGTVTHIDSSGDVIGTPAKVSPAPKGVGCGEGWVWAVNDAQNGLVRVRQDGTTTMFDTRAAPVSVTFDQGVWTAHADGHVTRFDPRTGHLKVNANISVAPELDAIAARENDTSVWATSKQTMTLYRISN
ncbi:MAG: CHAT domain-containing protein, partial [Solirubrobacterales bacterium]|nr:CHAT domain-containing protein [Solirubrobacterales bacterium]